MPDEPMFAKLMNEQASAPSTDPPVRNPGGRTRHVTIHLTEAQVAMIDRYFKLLYDNEPRPTRSSIVGAAIEVFDRLLGGERPGALDASLLDAYLRTHAGARAPARARTDAPAQGGTRER